MKISLSFCFHVHNLVSIAIEAKTGDFYSSFVGELSVFCCSLTQKRWQGKLYGVLRHPSDRTVRVRMICHYATERRWFSGSLK